MNTLLLKQVTYMCLCLMLGTINWVIAPMTSKLWIFILDEVAAAICFIMAYICYRRARKIAETIDDKPTLTLTIIHHGEESESKDKQQGESEAEAPCNDESEDEYAHPV